MKNTTRFSLALVAFALLAFSTVPAFAQAPASLPVQGYLTDGDGAPLDGSAELTFTLYNAGGDALFTTSQTATLDRGAFSVVLGGQGEPLDLTIFRDNSVLQLGVAIDGGAELSPRFDIATSPFAGFAQYSGDAATLEGLAATDFAQVGDSLGGLNCSANGEVPTWDGSAWTCGTSSDTVGDLSCMAGQVATYDGTAWACSGDFVVGADLATVATSGSFADLANIPADLADGDNDTTYTAGTGVTLTGTEFSIDTAALDSRFVNEGQANSVSATMLQDGSVTNAKVAADAINSAKIANGSVTAADLAPGSVTNAKIANDAVTSEKIDWNANSNTDVVTTTECGTFVPVDFCISAIASLVDCDDADIAVGSFCEYDFSPGCTVTSTTTFDSSLDNCTGGWDIYMRLN